jgi:hypothetical protein
MDEFGAKQACPTSISGALRERFAIPLGVDQ